MPSRDTLDAWGIQAGYRGYDGAEHEPPEPTVEAIFDAMRASDEAPPSRGPVIVTQGDDFELPGAWEITAEDGATSSGNAGTLAHDFPLGYHRLCSEGGETMLVIAPRACAPAPQDGSWGWAMQLYATRSSQSWGIGDLGDLAKFARLSRSYGAGLVMLNPLHASLPGIPQEPSPYFPSSRSFRNPIYIAVERIAGANTSTFAGAGRALNEARLIDRDEVWRLKLSALEAVWEARDERERVEQYIASHGEALERYATFCVLVEQHGRSWQRWPGEYRHPSSPAVKTFGTQHRDRVRFHAWLQMVLEEQVDAAETEIPLMNDLAIGVDPSGADAWLWQDALALDMRVGAPPDEFNTLGQDWGFPPFDPWRLRALDYEPFITTVRANLASASAVRIDHALGLFRLFWMPAGSSPTDGTYVRYPSHDLLSILALESVRAGSYVVGEDLGTVEDHMREALAQRNVLSYKLVWFQPERPNEYPERSMAAVTTHDLPTVGGLWTGRDLEIQHKLDLNPNDAATESLVHKVRDWTGKGPGAPVDEVSQQIHRLLGDSTSAVVTATLEDAFGIEERPNYPGTVDEWPNWSVALPVPIDEMERHQGFVTLADVMTKGRKHSR